MGGVQLKYINIENEDESLVTSQTCADSSELTVEDIEDYDLDSCNSQSELISQGSHTIGQNTDQPHNPFISIDQSQATEDVHFYNEGFDMTVFSKERSDTEERQSSDEVGPMSTDQPKGQGQRSEKAGLGQTLRPDSTLSAAVFRESSFASNSASSGYVSGSERNTPQGDRSIPRRPAAANRAAHVTTVSKGDAVNTEAAIRDYSAFITQPDRERLSNRGRDMTVYMYVIGGKESRAQNISFRPINLWKLEIY